MPLVTTPVPPPLDARLRALVLTDEPPGRRRDHPSVLRAAGGGGASTKFPAPWAGRPGRTPVPRHHEPRDGALDHAARTDVAGRLLDGLPEEGRPLVWLTRPPAPEEPDEDRAWLAAVLAAAAERGLDPWWVVVTRHGWHDPRSGAAWDRRRRR